MRIVRLEAENLLSYDRLDLPMEDLSQVGVIGGTGAGKSALLDVIRFALFGSSRYPQMDDVLRKGTDRCVATITFDLHGRRYVVRRERDVHTKRGESSLTLTIDGDNKSKHAVPETQALIQRELGLNEDALLAGPFMVQREIAEEPRDLMHLKAAGRKQLLVQLFDLTKYDAYGARAKEWSLQAHAALDVLEHRVTELDATIATELDTRRIRDEAIAAREEANAEVDRLAEKLTTLREEAAALQERATRQEALEAEMNGHQTRADQQTVRLTELRRQLSEREIRLQQKPIMPPTDDVESIEVRLREVLPAVAELPGLREKRGETEALWRQEKSAIAVLHTVPCQSIRGDKRLDAFADMCLDCQFLVDAKAAQGRHEETTEAGKALAKRIEELEEQRKYAEALARERQDAVDQKNRFESDQAGRANAEEFIGALTEQIADAEGQIATASEALQRLNAERLRIAQDVTRRQELRTELGDVAVQYEHAKTRRTAMEHDVLKASTALNAITEAKKRREEIEADRQELTTRCDGLRLLSQAFHRDGIPTLILENGIPLIEERANDVLHRMPGGWQVQLLTQRQTKTAGIAEVLDVQITASGVEYLYAGLSGGERFRVDFALRMALATVLARRAGTSIETLWLDEGFGGQDREGIAALMQAIDAVADEFGLIVVVSHVREVTDALPERLEVAKHDAVSRVERAA